MVVGVDLVFVGEGGLVVEDRPIGRRPDVGEVAGEPIPAGPPRPGEGVAVEDPVGRERAHHLAGADEGPEEVRALLDGQHTEDRAPRLAEQVDPVLAEALAQVVGDGDRVGEVALERDGRGRIELGVGLAGPSLIPGDDGEALLEGGQVVAHGPHLRTAGAPGQEQQHRVVGAVAADHHRQVVAADLDAGEFGDAPGWRRAVGPGDRVGRCRADQPGQHHDQPDGCEYGDAAAQVEAHRSPSVAIRGAADPPGDAGADRRSEE